MCPSDSSSQCFPSCGAPAHPPHSTCTTSHKVNLLGSILPTKAKTPWPVGPTTMLTKWNTTSTLCQVRANPTGPAPRLLSPQATLLPGLEPRPRSTSSPLGGNRCFMAGYLGSRAITTNLTLRPPLSHLPLSDTTLTLWPLLSHYDHQHSCLKEKWHKGSASSTSPRSPEPEPTQSQGAPW